jgi:hypothetical protein
VRPSLAIAVFLACPAIYAQQESPIIVPEIHPTVIGGSINEYVQSPPDINLLPHGQGARAGRLWVRNIGNGLLIVGDIEGGAPEFPRNKNLLLSKDHIEVWLAAASDVDMPDIGWGNQFGETLLPKGAESCPDSIRKWSGKPDALKTAESKCREWVMTQQHYRPLFSRLFARQWLLTPDYAIESFATPAYNEITAKFASDLPRNQEEVPKALMPHGSPKIWLQPSVKGYTFQILIPYVFFPPLPALEVQDLRVLVDVFRPAPPGKKMGPYSTSSPARMWGKPETFNNLRLDPPRTFDLTPCNMPLKGADAYRDMQDAWFIPKSGQEWEYESDAFLVVNGSGGYRYDPDGLSPVIRPLHYFWHNVSPGEWVCGPQLTYKNGKQLETFEETVAEEGFDTRRAQNGDLLVKVGPRVYYSEFGSGQCGACPRTDIRIFGLTRDMKIYQALELGDFMGAGPDSPQSQDFEITADWSQVTVYDQAPDDEDGSPGSWSSTAWCLRDSAYEECRKKDDVQPPDPPLLKELRPGDH